MSVMSVIPVSAQLALAVEHVPTYVVERYHRTFPPELVRLRRLLDGCGASDDVADLHGAFDHLASAVIAHIVVQERDDDVFDGESDGLVAALVDVDAAVGAVAAGNSRMRVMHEALLHFVQEVRDHVAIEATLCPSPFAATAATLEQR